MTGTGTQNEQEPIVSLPQLLNDPENFLGEALEGFEETYADLVAWHRTPSFVTRRGARATDKAAIISGGGSGHEPLHAGFVGVGMLDAAVPGAIFTSPSARQIVAATKAVATHSGVLYVVKNYTGDVVNFELAADECRDLGIAVETVVVADDVATAGASDRVATGRGTAAAIVVEKICGAAAERLLSVDEVAELGRRAAAASRSVGMAVIGSRRPGQSEPSFRPPAGCYEFGVGIHGERGTGHRPWASVSEIANDLVEAILERLPSPSSGDLLAIVNNLGTTPELELHVLSAAVRRNLAARGIRVTRSLVGSYLSALDMRGCSVTLAVLDAELGQLWDAAVTTPALRW
jgi:phosphoenolpyruvate---glycerone phosphotransferase subunit DhaK